LKITCLTESISQLGGGLFDAERRMQQSVMSVAPDIEVDVLGMMDQRSSTDMAQWDPVKANAIATSKMPPGLGYSKGFAKHLFSQQPDVAYCIGLWKYFSKSCLQWHRETDRPYIVAPHGMLDPWAIQNHRMRKKLLMLLYQRSHLESAACIRALNIAELNAIRSLQLTNPVCVIPNGVDKPEFDRNANVKSERPTVLFLGRLHPKKGVEVLLDAWQKFTTQSRKDWRLKIVGWGNGNYPEKLQDIVATKGLADSVEMAGPLFGKQKRQAFLEAEAFILPSFSEGMPMTVLEAWSYELPVIMTPQCNIPEGVENDAAIACNPDAASVFESLEKFANMSRANRTALGQNGRRLVDQQFTWDVVSQKMAGVYRWLSGQASQPDCVVVE